MLDTRLGYASICKRVAGHTYWEIFFWRRGISFCFGSFMFPLTAAIFSFKCRNSRAAMGVKSNAQHGSKMRRQPKQPQNPCMDCASSSKRTSRPSLPTPDLKPFKKWPSVVAAKTWHCKRPHVSLETTMDVPLPCFNSRWCASNSCRLQQSSF